MIQLNWLTKKYWKNIAIENINLQINNWECFCLLWRNGAWKSTLIKILVWVIKPDIWQVLIDWIDLEKNPIKAKKKFSYISDIPYIYDKISWIDYLVFIWKLYWIENILLKDKIIKLSKLFDIENKIYEKTDEYSHWMRQKLLFCAALLTNPEYIILDEPTVWLDPQSQILIKTIIKNLTKDFWVWVLLSTHEFSLAKQIWDRIWIIHDSKIIQIIENNINLTIESLEQIFLNITGNIDQNFNSWIRQK